MDPEKITRRLKDNRFFLKPFNIPMPWVRVHITRGAVNGATELDVGADFDHDVVRMQGQFTVATCDVQIQSSTECSFVVHGAMQQETLRNR
jgi:hypothetical protein